MLHYQHAVILAFLTLIVLFISSRGQKVIPGEQFKINNFTEELWHPHLAKSAIDGSHFVLVDTYKEHMTAKKTPVRLQTNAKVQTKNKNKLKDNNDSPPPPEPAAPVPEDVKIPGQDPNERGPFN